MARSNRATARSSEERELALDEEEGTDVSESEPVQPDAGPLDHLANMTRNAPFLSSLGGLSPTYAIRWLLWLFAVLGSLSGICLVVVGTLAGLMVLGPLSTSIQAVLSDAGSTVDAAAGGVDAAMPLTIVMVNVSNSTAGSLLNISLGLNSMGSSLDSLSNIAGIDTGLGTSAASMRGAAANLAPAIASLQGVGTSASDLNLRLTETSASMRKASENLSATRQSIGMSVFYAQLMVVMFGLGLMVMLSGVLMLALAYGPPKKN